MEFTVSQVAQMASITVRTLHHYDRIGLLTPGRVGSNGYRSYTDCDLERLQQILFFRELGVGLNRIAAILDDPDFDRGEALRNQRALLVAQRARLEQLITTIDRTIAAEEGEKPMCSDSMFTGFDRTRIEKQITTYRDEAIERWGRESVEESEQRVRGMSQQDWDEIGAESNSINQELARLMDTLQPSDPHVQKQIELWYRLLNRHFATYSPEAFRSLGDLYVNDPRFTANYDKVRPGLALFLRDGMHAWADRAVREE